ncbi:hypothetical protein [Cellulosimicrobium sp. Marseille-Q4280]|uniref:hypothetical protein n=1 Tax=Cellulosimicrobium sp. Marseille-Q4280 TaxID=2937992 RepID=UPI002040CA95|nr:hypothetical protein [Cellulosimicrobium sp. Marseille-Q4280]
MSTSARSRVPAGVTTGGQFATEARSESDVDLAPAPAPERDDSALPGLLDAAEKRLDALYAQGLGDRHGYLRLAATAACVRLADPEAIGFELDGWDDADAMYVSRVIWAGEDEGEEVGDHFDFEDADLDRRASGVAVSSSMDKDLLDDSGDNRFMIDEVISGLEEPEPAQPGAAGAEAVERFRAEHLPLGTSDADAVRALIADLDAWAKANDVDLARQFSDATDIPLADDLDELCEGCGRTMTNGECPVHG